MFNFYNYQINFSFLYFLKVLVKFAVTIFNQPYQKH